MAQMRGVAEAIIRQIGDVSGINTPQYKVTPPGFLQLLLNNPAPISIVNLAQIDEGHDRLIKLRYMKRGTISQTSTNDTCDEGSSATYNETTLTHPLFRKLSLYISDKELETYYDDATKTQAIGNPATGIMAELYNRIIVKLNGLIGAIDSDMLAQMATAWGVNAATGVATPTAISFTTLQNAVLNDGIVKLIDEAQINEILGDLLIVGNGKFNAFNIANRFQSGPNADGYKLSNWGGFKWYNDAYSQAAWGANHLGVIAQGSAGFVQWNRFVGYRAGTKGPSYFFTLPVPMMLDNGQLTSLVFDVQLKAIDCPTEIEGVTRDRGYIMYISKSFGLFTMPTDAYETDDRLNGCNGLLHYIAS